MADFRLRVTYAETGRLVMLSHLEIARALERAVRRAGLPYAVSQGFSPHMKQAFGSALPVGVGGLEEIFDVSLTDYVPPEEALARLRASSAPDLMPHAARYITKDETAASAAYPRSTYEALLERRVRAIAKWMCSRQRTNFRFLPRLRWFARRRSVCLFLPSSSLVSLRLNLRNLEKKGRAVRLFASRLNRRRRAVCAPMCCSNICSPIRAFALRRFCVRSKAKFQRNR